MEPSGGDRGLALGVVFLYLVPYSDLDCILDDVLVHCVVSFQSISSGAQLGRSGICVAFGVVFFYFGSVVGP